jgi:signal transduction histidine kinase
MLPFFSKTLRKWILPPGAEKVTKGLEFWRNEFFFMICRLFFLGGIFLYVISIISYLREGAEQMVFPITALVAVLFTLIFWRKLPIRIRRHGIIGVLFLLGIYLLTQMGIQGVGLVFLFAHPIVAAVFFGNREAQIGLWTNVLLLALLTISLTVNSDMRRVLLVYYPFQWLSISLTFVFLNVTVTNAIVRLVSGLDTTLRAEVAAREKLEEQIEVSHVLQAQLQEERELLRERVEERTALLSTANQELMESMKFKDTFFASVTHELRTPIHVINGYTELMQKKAHELSSKQLGYLTHIAQGTDTLLNVINDILDMTRIQVGELSLKMAVVSLDDICRSALAYIQEEAVRKNVEVEPLMQKSDLNLMADVQRFKQIMINLLNNAVKFTPPGGRVGINVDQTDDALLVSVWDSGIGIPQKDIPSVFNPFFKAENRSGEDVEGTGLGLSLVKQLVEAHGWQVVVKSALDQGSTFTIHIPLDALTTEEPAAVYY